MGQWSLGVGVGRCLPLLIKTPHCPALLQGLGSAGSKRQDTHLSDAIRLGLPGSQVSLVPHTLNTFWPKFRELQLWGLCLEFNSAAPWCFVVSDRNGDGTGLKKKKKKFVTPLVLEPPPGILGK